MTDAVTRARADLEAGRAWKARDRLTSLLVVRQDDEVLDLLASVHLRMGDLPRAGALLYVLRRETPEAAEAIDAWRQRFGDPDARWRSIPAPIRRERGEELDVLRAGGGAEATSRDLPAPQEVSDESGWEVLGCLFAVLVLLGLIALVVIGGITVAGWIL